MTLRIGKVSLDDAADDGVDDEVDDGADDLRKDMSKDFHGRWFLVFLVGIAVTFRGLGFVYLIMD